MKPTTLSKEQLVCLAVEKGQVPRYLYKYCTVDRTLEILGNHSVWFSTYDQFNDPFDCAMQVDKHCSKEDWINYLRWQGLDNSTTDQIVDNIMANPNEGVNIIQKSIEQVKKDIGILCLSERPDNLQLWTYYADQHRGACIEFDVLADPELFCIPQRVSYDDSFPVINYLHDQSSVVEALKHKSKDWQIEGEYRIIKHHITGLKAVKPEALTKVILGLRCTEADINRIRQSLNPEVYPAAQLCRAVKHDHEYKLNIILFKQFL